MISVLASRCFLFDRITHTRIAETMTICQRDGICTKNKIAATPALTAPPRLYIPWHVLMNSLLYLFSIKFTVAFADTPFKKLMVPRQYRQAQNIIRFTELICKIIIPQITRVAGKHPLSYRNSAEHARGNCHSRDSAEGRQQ